VNCPDFDTCSSCFSITYDQHPQHGFVKIRNTDDLMIRNGLAADVRHYASCDGCQKTIYGTRYKCMHPDCPDFDLCGVCEAHPIPVHPSTHPMLKMKTADTVVPTVYRVGQTQMISNRGEPKEATREDDKSRPLPTPPMPAVVINEKPLPDIQTERAVETEASSSMESSVTGFTLPPLALDPRSDLFREFWPRVTEELRHHSRSSVASRTASQEQGVNDVAMPHANDAPAATVVDPFRDPEPKPIVVKLQSPDLSTQALLSRPIPTFNGPEMAQSRMAPVANISLAALLNNYRSASPTFSGTLAESVGSVEDDAQIETVPSVPCSPALEPAPLVILMASFISDTTVPDGQIFPPGAEFVKSWRMVNNGPSDWPETTELHYAAGEKFSLGSQKVKVGKVATGVEVDVWTGELKAPEAPGKYRSYWRLSDGKGLYFGHSLWVDITVAETGNQSDGSLASSSVIMMPQAAASAHSSGPSVLGLNRQIMSLTRESSATATSKLSMDDTASDGGSVGSSVSLISVPSSDEDDEDEDDWQDSRAHLVVTPPQNSRDAAEYIVLYDDASSDEE
jgi:next-to-BRCA1 protein 1